MKISFSRVAAAALMTMSSAASIADDGSESGKAAGAIEGRFYLSPMASYTIADSKRGTDDGIGGALSLGKQLSNGFALELSGVYTAYGAKQGGSSAKLTAGQANVLFFPGQMNFYGLLGMGFGEVRSQPGATEKYSNSLWNAGMGYLIGPFNLGVQGISLRVEALFRADSHAEKQVGETTNNSFREASFNVGLLIPIGAAAKEVAAPEETVAVVPVAGPADSDGDGVADEADQCPGSEAGSAVAANGCAAAAQDSGTAEAPGAAADSSSECKLPEPGQAVTEQGCAAPNTLSLSGVSFDQDKAELTEKAKKILDELAEGLQASPKIRIEVDGYAQSSGDEAQDKQLSEQRAKVVSDYLVGRGVDAGRISAIGLGAVADMGSRVEIKVLP